MWLMNGVARENRLRTTDLGVDLICDISPSPEGYKHRLISCDQCLPALSLFYTIFREFVEQPIYPFKKMNTACLLNMLQCM